MFNYLNLTKFIYWTTLHNVFISSYITALNPSYDGLIKAKKIKAIFELIPKLTNFIIIKEQKYTDIHKYVIF